MIRTQPTVIVPALVAACTSGNLNRAATCFTHISEGYVDDQAFIEHIETGFQNPRGQRLWWNVDVQGDGSLDAWHQITIGTRTEDRTSDRFQETVVHTSTETFDTQCGRLVAASWATGHTKSLETLAFAPFGCPSRQRLDFLFAPSRFSTFHYDERQRLILEEVTDADGRFIAKVTTSYGDGEQTVIADNSGNALVDQTDRTIFDDEGRVVELIRVWENNRESHTYVYDGDLTQTWTRELETDLDRTPRQTTDVVTYRYDKAGREVSTEHTHSARGEEPSVVRTTTTEYRRCRSRDG